MLITSGILDRMREERAQYQDFAVLYRTNSQSRALEEALRRRNVPYMVYSGNSFFERAEIKDMMAYFKLVVNPHDDESFKRAVNKPARGIGDTSLEALTAAARAHGVSLFKAVYAPDLPEHGLKNAAISKLRAFCDMINALAARVPSTDALVLAQRIADDSGLYAFFKTDTSVEGMSRTSNVEELINSVAQFVEDRQNEYLAEIEQSEGAPQPQIPVVTLGDFLENTSLLSNVDLADEEDTNNKVALMTVHSAKGLEFPYVYVAGMEENLFPTGGMMASASDVEEERRLFYVAMTRAKKAVDLTFTSTRMRNGRHESNAPSRFIREIDPKYIANPLTDRDFDLEDEGEDAGFGGFGSHFFGRGGREASGRGGYRYGGSSKVTFFKRDERGSSPRPAPQPPAAPARRPVPSAPAAPRYDEDTFVPSPMRDFTVGQRIEHNRFGPGLILDITGTFPELKAKIAFDDYAEPKTILLKYAKMRPEQK